MSIVCHPTGRRAYACHRRSRVSLLENEEAWVGGAVAVVCVVLHVEGRGVGWDSLAIGVMFYTPARASTRPRDVAATERVDRVGCNFLQLRTSPEHGNRGSRRDEQLHAMFQPPPSIRYTIVPLILFDHITRTQSPNPCTGIRTFSCKT